MQPRSPRCSADVNFFGNFKTHLRNLPTSVVPPLRVRSSVRCSPSWPGNWRCPSSLSSCRWFSKKIKYDLMGILFYCCARFKRTSLTAKTLKISVNPSTQKSILIVCAVVNQFYSNSNLQNNSQTQSPNQIEQGSVKCLK